MSVDTAVVAMTGDLFKMNPRTLFAFTLASAVAINANNQQLYTAGHDGTLKFWQLPIAPSRALAAPHGDQVTAVVLSPDGNKLITASIDKTVRVSNFTNGQQERVLAGPAAAVNAIATNGTLIAVSPGEGCGHEIKLLQKHRRDRDYRVLLNPWYFVNHSSSVPGSLSE